MKINQRFGMLILAFALVFGISEATAQAATSDKDALSPYDIQENLTIKSAKMQKSLKSKIKKTYRKSIFIGDSASLYLSNDLDDYDVSFKSSNDNILDVTQINDTICDYTGVAAGKAKIIIKIKPKFSLFFWNKPTVIKANVTVSPKAASIKFSRSKYQLNVGQKKVVKTTIRPSITKEKPVFASLNSKIVTFIKGNTLLAKSTGKTFITATIENGMKAKCKIIVRAKHKK